MRKTQTHLKVGHPKVTKKAHKSINNSGLEALKKLASERVREKYKSVPEFAIPTQKFSDKTSNQLSKSILNWICLNGYQAERIAVTGRRIDRRKTITDGIGRKKVIGSVDWIKSSMQPGTADISATINGKSIKIEIKIGKDKQSEAQKTYQQQVEKAGGIYLIVKDFQCFYEWFLDFVGKGVENE